MVVRTTSSRGKSQRGVAVSSSSSSSRKRDGQGKKQFPRLLIGFLALIVWIAVAPCYRSYLLPYSPSAAGGRMSLHMFARHDEHEHGNAKDNALIDIPLMPRMCGTSWTRYKDLIQEDASAAAGQEEPFLWSVSGGAEYREQLPFFLTKWHSLGLAPALIVALDQETADAVCEFGQDLGFSAVLWDQEEAMTYSKVADSKFLVASTLARLGYYGLFLELDVFCRTNPVSLIKSYSRDDRNSDLVVLGHGDVNHRPNIGMYYVKPTLALAEFFENVHKVLTHSKDSKWYLNQDNFTKEFFDQEEFNHCLPDVLVNQHGDSIVAANDAMYALHDIGNTNNFLRTCKSQDTLAFNYSIVPHIYINSYSPPNVYDTTICIHPLASAPFSPLAHKLATAKYLGFDPTTPQQEKEQHYLKTASGDLVMNECWNVVFTSWSQVHNSPHEEERMQLVVATLVWLAQKTDRVLILPNMVRDKDSFAVHILSILDVRTLPVEYRFHLPDATTKQPAAEATEAATIVVPQEVGQEDVLLEQILELQDTKVVAIESYCKVFIKKYNEVAQEIEDIRTSITFCTDEPVTFAKGPSHWGNLCGSKLTFVPPPPNTVSLAVQHESEPRLQPNEQEEQEEAEAELPQDNHHQQQEHQEQNSATTTHDAATKSTRPQERAKLRVIRNPPAAKSLVV